MDSGSSGEGERAATILRDRYEESQKSNKHKDCNILMTASLLFFKVIGLARVANGELNITSALGMLISKPIC